LGDQLEVGDTLADRHPKLVGVHDPRKGLACRAASFGLGQEIVVLCEEDATQLGGPIENLLITVTSAAIFVDRKDVDSPEPEPLNYRPIDVFVSVQRKAHDACLSVRSFA
jgi:hypothetical protein